MATRVKPEPGHRCLLDQRWRAANHDFYDLRRARTGRLAGQILPGPLRQLYLQLEGRRQQLVLAPEVGIERALRDPRRGRDLVYI